MILIDIVLIICFFLHYFTSCTLHLVYILSMLYKSTFIAKSGVAYLRAVSTKETNLHHSVPGFA